MRVPRDNPAFHLTYCLNIHPGETWADVERAVRTYACRVRDSLGCVEPFGLGLRLSHLAVEQLAEPGALQAFQRLLRDERLYVFTVNGFPYGPFHGVPVKQDVYAPDWRTEERVAYTIALAELLAQLLPEGVPGSISTVPGTYRAWCRGPEDRREILRGLGRAALAFAEIAGRTGKQVRLALEPEPDCLWDRTDQMVKLFGETLPDEWSRLVAEGCGVPIGQARVALEQHLGVCLDTCHQAVCFEDVAGALESLRDHAVPVAKVQVSAAPFARENTLASRGQLAAFADSVYLHQCAVRTADGAVRRFQDLAQALQAAESLPGECEVRTHAHIPLSVSGWQDLGSTRTALDDRFFRLLAQGLTPHVEVETYTFDVLPEPLRERGVVASVASELNWFLDSYREATTPSPE